MKKEKLRCSSHFPEKICNSLPAILLVVSVLVLTATFLTSPDTEWKTEVLEENVSERFVAVDANEEVGVFYQVSREGGVKAATNSIQGFHRVLGWTIEKVDEEEGTGMFLSAETIDGKTALSYQNGNIGEAELLYNQKNGDWNRETVDSIGERGPNVGIYNSLTSYQDRPLIFYHAEQGDRFMMAEKLENTWEREEIETGMGWFTDTASCSDKVFAALREKGEDQLYLGTYDGEWEMEELDAETDTDVAVTSVSCEPVVAYLDINSWNVKAEIGDEVYEFEDSRFSRISLDSKNDNVHMVYNVDDKGLYYASYKNGWEEENISDNPDSGSYNDIAVDSEGNPHIAYLENDKVIYTGKMTETDGKFIFVRILSILLIILILTYWIYNKNKAKKLSIIKSRLFK